MPYFKIVWTHTAVEEEWIEADNEEEAKSEWEWKAGLCGDADPELFFIEDEDGNQTIY